MPREIDRQPSQIIDLGGRHQFNLLGKLKREPELTSEDGSWYFEVDYGAENVIECFIYNDIEEPLFHLNEVNKLVRTWYTPENSTVDGSVLVHAGSHLQGSNPVFAMDKLETLSDPITEGTIILSQSRISYQHNSMLACVNLVFGYRETFDAIFNQLVDSWTNNSEANTPFYRELFITELKNKPVGFIEVALLQDSNGDLLSRKRQSLIVPSADYSFMLNDAFARDHADSSGKLIHAYGSATNNGKFVYTLNLANTGENNWQVQGRMRNRDVEFFIASLDKPASVISMYRQMQQLVVNSKSNQTSFRYWEPGADPSSFLRASTDIASRKENANVFSSTMGPIRIKGKVLDSGSMDSAEITKGRMTLRLRRVYATGSF